MSAHFTKWGLLSVFAIQAGLKPSWKVLRGQNFQKRRLKSIEKHDPKFRRLSEQDRCELLESIRLDDWFE